MARRMVAGEQSQQAHGCACGRPAARGRRGTGGGGGDGCGGESSGGDGGHGREPTPRVDMAVLCNSVDIERTFCSFLGA